MVLRPPPQENQGFKNTIIKENLDVIWVWEYLDMNVMWACLHMCTLLCSVAENLLGEREDVPVCCHSENPEMGGMIRHFLWKNF